MSEINPGLTILLNRDILQYITCFHTNSARKFITCGRAHLLPGHLARLLPHLGSNLGPDAEYIVNSGDSRYLEFISKYDLLAPMLTALNLAYKLKKIDTKPKSINPFFKMIWGSSNVLSKAAYFGHKQVVEYIVKNCPDIAPDRSFPFAARAGHLEILQILHKNWPFCPKKKTKPIEQNYYDVGHYLPNDPIDDVFDEYFMKNEFMNDVIPINYACEFGHIDVLKWLMENRYDPSFQLGEALVNAATKGHLHILKYLETVNNNIEAHFISYHLIIRGGHFETLKWMYARYPEDLSKTTTSAAKSGNLEILQWLNMLFPGNINHDVLESAAISGNIEMFDWILGLYCPNRDTNIINYAASSGNLDLVKHIIDYDFKVDHGAMDQAARNGHFEVVKWLHNSGYDCTRNAMNWAAKFGHFNIVKWLYENRTEGCDYYAATDAAENNHFEIVKFIVDKYPMVYHAAEILVITCKRGNNDIAKWIFEHNLARKDKMHTYDISIQFVDTAIFIAKGSDNNEMAKWLEAEKHKLGEPVVIDMDMPESNDSIDLPEIDYHEHLMAEMYTAD